MQKYSPISDDTPNMREDSEHGSFYWCEEVEALLQSNAATSHAVVSGLNARVDRLEEALQRISDWAKAYPLDVFPEPDFKKVHEALQAANLSLDCVSASNMRHVITQVGDIANTALMGS